MDIVNKSKEQIYNEAFLLGYNQALEDYSKNVEAEARELREKLTRLKEKIEYLQVNIPNK